MVPALKVGRVQLVVVRGGSAAQDYFRAGTTFEAHFLSKTLVWIVAQRVHQSSI
jgi:hypothetical protein